MTDSKRRSFIKAGMAMGASGLFIEAARATAPTPKEIEGPFYPVIAQKDRDFDLTKVEGKTGIASGEIIIIQGKILDEDNTPIENASVDLWQANAAGRYRHPHDTNKAPLDPHFQGWAIVQSGKAGRFRFKTIIPGAYPASGTWIRPPHIHFKISKKGYIELITQMYFPGHKLNDSDLLLKRKTKAERKLMMASQVDNKPDALEFNIVLKKA